MNSVQALYQKISDPVEAAWKIGIWLAKSNMLGQVKDNPAEVGSVIAFDALARGIPITETLLNYHVVCGRLTMKAESMLAGFHALGGRHIIHSQTADLAQITFEIEGESETFAISWEDAQQENWPWVSEKGNKKSLKTNWATPIARADMLWARTVSRGVRKLRPSVTNGKYTPEEILDLAEYSETISSNRDKPADVDELLKQAGAKNGVSEKPKPIKPIAPAEQPAVPVVASEPTSGEGSLAGKDTPQVVPVGQQSTDGFATAQQTGRIRDLFAELNIPGDKQEAILAKRGVNALRSLTVSQATELITNLEAKIVKDESTKLPENIKASPDSAPCTQSQIDAILKVVGEIAEHDATFKEKYKARLIAQGKQRTANLSIRQADAVLASLVLENMECFFTRSLEQLVEDHAADTEPPKN